jgi:hypothetical protein
MADRLAIATQTAAEYFKAQKKIFKKSSNPVGLKRIVDSDCGSSEKHALMYVTEEEMAAVLCWGGPNAQGTETSKRMIRCGPSGDWKNKVRPKRRNTLEEEGDRTWRDLVRDVKDAEPGGVKRTHEDMTREQHIALGQLKIREQKRNRERRQKSVRQCRRRYPLM